MTVIRVRENVYRVCWSGIEGLATVKGAGILLSPNLRGKLGMRGLRDAIKRADKQHTFVNSKTFAA